jgi:magnesium transporter
MMTPSTSTSPRDPDRDPEAIAGEADMSAWLSRTNLDAGRVRRLLGTASSSAVAHALRGLSPPRASEILLLLPPEQAASVLTQLEPPRAAELLVSLPSDERADLLAAVEVEARDAIADCLPEPLKAEAARLLRYPPDTAGGLMETEVLAKPAGVTVREVIADLRANQPRYAAMGVQYLYVVDESRRLAGVAPLRDLLLAPEDALLATLVRPDPISVKDSASTAELADLFDTHPYYGVPVVDAGGVLLGTVNRADVTESEQHQSEEQYRRSQGIVGGEELRSMPVSLRVRRRGAWLGVNLILCLGGAGVIAAFRETLANAIVVAAVLPVVSATSGNAAMQAAAVSVREQALGVIEMGAWRRVLAQELTLAVVLAIPLGASVAGLAVLWGGGWAVGAAVGAAMALNAALAVVFGALCPLLLRRMKVDPALASGPVTTTLADVSGFTMTLAFVTWMT